MLAFRLSALVLFAAAVHIAVAEEVTLPEGYVPVNLVTNVGGSASSDTTAFSSSYPVSKAFDGKYYSDNTRWIGKAGTFPQRAVWTFPVGTVVDTIRIYNASYSGASNSPSEFTFSGWDEVNSAWIVLDEETGVTGWSSSQNRTFQFSNLTPYKKYRLEVTAPQSGNRMTITEIELYRVNQASFDVVPSGSPTVGIDSFSTDWILAVEEGSTADAGLVWSTDESFATATTNSLGTGLAAGTRTASLTGLEPDTTYWWKIFATNATDSAETEPASFKTTGAPVFGTCSATASGNAATFSVALAEAALDDTLSTAVSVHYGTDGESWTALPLGSSAAAATMTGSLEGLDYGTTYQWFALATATMEGGRVLSTSTATNSFTALWSGDMFVDAAAENATEPFSTPETAAKTIAAALALATDGATIHVAPGLYSISSQIQVLAGVRIVGTDPSRTIVSNTVNSSNSKQQQRVFKINHADAFIANLTMQNGSTYAWGVDGGNFLIESSGGTVSNCIVEASTQSQANGHAAGGYLKAGLVTHTVFRRNRTRAGSANQASNRCGVLQLEGSAHAENCLFTDNQQATAVTLINVYGSSVMRNCTIVNSGLSLTNQYCSSWSALNIASGATVQNVVIAGVTNTVDGEACKPTGTRANFVNGALDSSIEGTTFPATTIVGTAESFFKNYANGDYTLNPTSMLVNAGINYEGMASVDLAGKARKSGKIVDIGCYEHQMPNGFFIVVR